MLTDHLDECPTDKPIVVSCGTGARSAIGQSLLLKHGYKDVINLEGGWLGWRQAGLPVAND
jgi:hydroxyacylglutathione hydrolase